MSKYLGRIEVDNRDENTTELILVDSIERLEVQVDPVELFMNMIENVGEDKSVIVDMIETLKRHL